MKDHYETEIKEAPESHAAKGYDRAALEATIKQAEPVKPGAAGQMTDTPMHTQGDAPDCLLQSARMAEHRQAGLDPGLEAFKDPAIEKGIYSPDKGTDLQGLADVMMERPGIKAHLDNASGPEDVKSALDSGDSVIASVDAYEFYKDQFNLEPNSGHARPGQRQQVARFRELFELTMPPYLGAYYRALNPAFFDWIKQASQFA